MNFKSPNEWQKKIPSLRKHDSNTQKCGHYSIRL